jgi:hypothetical protein
MQNKRIPHFAVSASAVRRFHERVVVVNDTRRACRRVSGFGSSVGRR